MVESILRDKRKILPCAAWLEGEYGIHGVFVGVPVMLGTRGIEKVYEIHLTEEELKALRESAGHVLETQGALQM